MRSRNGWAIAFASALVAFRRRAALFRAAGLAAGCGRVIIGMSLSIDFSQSQHTMPPMASLGPRYRKLWSASALSNLADGVFQVALPLMALRITRSPAAIAGVAVAGRLPWLLFALHAGALADRLDRRRTMTIVNIGRSVVIGTLAALVASDAATLAVLYVVAFALGCGETLFDTAAQSIMPMLVERDDLSAANGRLYAAELTMNQFLGPPLGGALAGIAIALAFAGSATAYAVSGLLLALLAGSFRPTRTGPRTRLRTDIAEGARFLARHRLLRTLAVMVGVMNLAEMALFSVFPIYAVAPGPLGLTEGGFGLLLTTGALGSLAGSLLTARAERRFGRARVLWVAVLGSGVPALAMALSSNVWAVAAACVFGGFTVIGWNVVTVSLRQRIVPDHLLGRVNAGYRLVAWGTMPIGAALGGALAELAGLRAVFLLSATAHVALLVFVRVVTDETMDAAEAEEEPAPVT